MHKFASAVGKIDVERTYLHAVKDTQEYAADLNRQQMNEDGVDSQGKSLGRYKESTKNRKRKKGQPTDHITLRDTGNFQDRIFLDTKQIPVLMDSKDGKTSIIEKRWPKALGLVPTNLELYKQRVMTVFRKKIKLKIDQLKEKILS